MKQKVKHPTKLRCLFLEITKKLIVPRPARQPSESWPVALSRNPLIASTTFPASFSIGRRRTPWCLLVQPCRCRDPTCPRGSWLKSPFWPTQCCIKRPLHLQHSWQQPCNSTASGRSSSSITGISEGDAMCAWATNSPTWIFRETRGIPEFPSFATFWGPRSGEVALIWPDPMTDVSS